MRIELNLKKSDRIMTAWEISNFLNNLGGKHYKISLLNEMAPFINTNKNDLFIMDKSFVVSTQYGYMSENYLDLNNATNIIRWYYLGVPIPFNKNNQILNEINLYFKIIRNINTELSSANLFPINRKELEKIFNLIINTSISFSEIDNKIINIFSEKIKAAPKESKKETEKYEKLYSKLSVIVLSKETTSKTFYEAFESLDRPVIGIYDKNNNSMKILCHHSISKNSISKDKLDIKKIEHNSPTFITLFAGTAFLAALIPCIQACRLKNKSATREEIQNKEREILNEISELQYIIDNNNIDNVSKIENSIIRTEFKDKQNKFFKEVESLIKNNKMSNDDFKINIIED